MPKSALSLLVEVLTQLGQGNIVKITPIHAELKKTVIDYYQRLQFK